MLNESIVATGIYYLAEENIAIDGTKQAQHSKLAFRLGLGQELEAELPYEQVRLTLFLFPCCSTLY